MFPAVAHARRRNIHSPDRLLNDARHRSPSDGIQPHSLSPRKSAPSAEPSPDAIAVGNSWMLRRAERSFEPAEYTAQEQAERSLPTASSTKSPSRRLCKSRGHYGFNATSHTNDRAVALAYRIQSHPFLKKDKDPHLLLPVSPSAKVSHHVPLPRVHVRGQFGHSVELDQSLVLNRGDIIQKYSNVTRQRGFQDAGALQDLQEENRQRKLNLPFPNPVPPTLMTLSLLEDASRKTSMQNMQYSPPPPRACQLTVEFDLQSASDFFLRRYLGLYAPFASTTTQGEFFLDSALPCAAIRVDSCASSSILEADDTSHLEKVRELVTATAASLNAASDCHCGPVSVLYCVADVNQRGILSPEYLDNVLIPAMASLLHLPSLSFVDVSKQGCGLVSSLVDRITAADAAWSVVVIDANGAVANEVDDATTEHIGDAPYRSLDSLISCCLKAVERACKLKILVVLPQSMLPAAFSQHLSSIANAPPHIVTFCQVPVNPLNCWDIADDHAVATSVPLMFTLLRILKSIKFEPDVMQHSKTNWWENWDAESVILKSVAPPIQTAISMLKGRLTNSPTRPASRACSAPLLPARLSMFSRASTLSLPTKTKSVLGNDSVLECMFPSIVCSFDDDMKEEEVIARFRIGGARIMLQDLLQSADSPSVQSSESQMPLFVSAAQFGDSKSAMEAEDLAHELIDSFSVQLHEKCPKTLSKRGISELEDLQIQLSQLITCDECEKRGLILILPSRSQAMLDCFHRSLHPIPSHVVIILLAPVRMLHQAKTWLHPTIQTHVDDVGYAQVHLDVAFDAASRMPACIDGHEIPTLLSNSAAEIASDAPSISWTQIYDTRCAIMLHRDFAKFPFAKPNSVLKQQKSTGRILSPYSPKGSPRSGSPSAARFSPEQGRRSPLSGSSSNGRFSPNQDARSSLNAHVSQKSHSSSLSRHPMCHQALSIACEAFSDQLVMAIVGTVVLLPGIPLHLLPQAATAIIRERARDSGALVSLTLPSRRELVTAAVCLAPFFFSVQASTTEMSFSSKFPRLHENFEAQFGISRGQWKVLQQKASLSLIPVADPGSDGTFAGLAGAGSWLCENLLLNLLNADCHDTACEVASNVLAWHAVQQRLGSTQIQVLMKRCCGMIEHLALQEGPETFKLRIFRSTLKDLRRVLEVSQVNLRENQHVGILEGLMLRLWLSVKPDLCMANLVCSALHRIATLQDRVLEIFKHSASILKSSAPGCVWRLLRRASAAEWLSHKQLLGVVVSGNTDVDSLLLRVRKNAVLLQACAFVRNPAS